MPDSPISSPRKRVLSGMRPTGKLHLGNYMGALANWVKLQDEYECYFFIADWHALTTDYADTSAVASNTLEVMMDYLGAGLDPEKSVLFLQSQVHQHAELFLILSMVTPLSWLERVPSYKEQQENLREKDLGTFGFLGYPLLQAADILLYQPQFVPVGQDQQAHVELTREIARRFNFLYPKDPEVRAAPIKGVTREEIRASGKEEQYLREHPSADSSAGLNFRVGISAERLWSPEAVVLPEPQVLLTPSPKLPGTDGRKMSKSYGNTILLTDPEPEVRKKLKTMVTDPARVRRSDPGDPDKCPVGDLHKVFSSPETLEKVYAGCRSAGIGCIECKGWAADSLVQILAPIQERRARFTEARAKEILEAGSRRAAKRAAQTMEEVYSAMQMTLTGEASQC
jgi:tryptophanyl-tRNA synthetase